MLSAVLAACGSSDDANSKAPSITQPASETAHGVSRDTIRIGMFTVSSSALDKAGGAASGNPDADVTGKVEVSGALAAMIHDVNSKGGIGGRRVEPVFYEVNPANLVSASGRQQETQAACAKWTEDNDVFAMMSMPDDSILDCAIQSKTPVIAEFLTPAYVSSARAAELSDLWFSPSNFTSDRREMAFVEFLESQGFFTKDARVGLMIEDRPAIRDGAKTALKAGLRAAGVNVVVEIHYPDPLEASWSNYVVQMRDAGVTHVLFSASGGGSFPPLLMMRAAEEQRYRPKWALGSDNGPAGLISLGQIPPAQLDNVLGMGWIPAADIGDSTPQGSTGQRCAQAATTAGEPAPYCPDILYFLQAALDGAKTITLSTLATRVGALDRRGYFSPSTIGGATAFGGRDARHDGAAVARAVTYDRASARMVYGSPSHELAASPRAVEVNR